MTKPTIAVIGGTGQQGGGLAGRLARAGFRVVIGSRNPAKAEAVADALNVKTGGSLVTGADNKTAAAQADIVILTVPFAGQQETAREIAAALANKILVDATVPLVASDIGKVQLPNAGSAVAALQTALPQTKVVSAFQNVSHVQLQDLDREIGCDILVCGNDDDACNTIIELIAALGMRGYHAGPIENSAAAEALTSVLIAISRKYKNWDTGFRITGVKDVEH